MLKDLRLLFCLMLVSCAPEAGKQLAAPLSAALVDIGTNANSLLKTGSQPQDLRVETIIKDDKTAQQQVVTITKHYDNVVAGQAKAQHRIFVDDCIFGAVALAILTPILIKLVPFLMAL